MPNRIHRLFPLLLLLPPLVYANNGNQPSQASPSNPTNTDQALLLPPPSDTTAHKLDLSNGPKDLASQLGPLVINKDGTTSRITNWHKMTPGEQATTLRIITARNRQRLKVLKEDL